ncbi:MAG: tRNA-guanine transglycosylase, partial [Acidimicrobiales bacterium]
FDCVLPTRLGRHGTILTDAGRLNLSNAACARDERPLDPDCRCEVCARWSRGYLRHLLRVHEPTVHRLLTLHNVTWLLGLVDQMRTAIRAGAFSALRREVLGVWAG